MKGMTNTNACTHLDDPSGYVLEKKVFEIQVCFEINNQSLQDYENLSYSESYMTIPPSLILISMF